MRVCVWREREREREICIYQMVNYLSANLFISPSVLCDDQCVVEEDRLERERDLYFL